MIESIQVILAIITLLGAVAVYLWKSPFDRLIGLSLMAGGIIPLIIDRGYLDVAIAIALLVPVTTIIMLLVCRRDLA